MNARHATHSSVATGSWSVFSKVTKTNAKTDLHKYEQKNGVRSQAHERRSPAFEQEPGPLFLERLPENLKHPFLAGLRGNVEQPIERTKAA